MTEQEARALLVQTARKYLGAAEGGALHREIIQIYNSISPHPRGFQMTTALPWCATFVTAMAKLCGMLDIIPAECSCGHQVQLFQKLGRWTENDNYKPAPGDVIYYYWSDSGAGDCVGWPDHVGIVESCSGGLITVIEGNRANSVSKRTIVVGARYIRGYGLPNFAAWAAGRPVTPAPVAPSTNTKEVPNMKQIRKGSTGYQVKVAQLLLILNGYSCGPYSADGDFGNATHAATVKYQRDHDLEADGIIGPKTWACLLGC